MVPRIEPAGTPTREDAVDRATCLPSPLAADDTSGKAGGIIKAYAVPVPSGSVLAPLYVGADLLDAFAIHLPAGRATISKCWRAPCSNGRRGGFAR